MPEPWHRPLSGLRDEFAQHHEDLRHLLVTIDPDVCEVPPTWLSRDPEDDCSRWGLPPEAQWRQAPGNEGLRPIVEQTGESGSAFIWKHTYYSRDAGSREPFLNLSYRVIRCLMDVPRAEYALLSEAVGLPEVPPDLRYTEPSLWWMRAVHGIAARRHEGSPLWSTTGPVSQFHPVKLNVEAQRTADQRGRSYSILNADVFQGSAQALELIRRTATPPDIVSVVPLQGRSPFCDLAGARRWTLRFVKLSPDQFPERTLRRAPPQFFPAIDRYAYRHILESIDGRYFHLGALDDFWGDTGRFGSDVLFIEDQGTLRRVAPESHLPVSLQFLEITDRFALDLLAESKLLGDLSDHLRRLLDRLLKPEPEAAPAVPAVAPSPEAPLASPGETLGAVRIAEPELEPVQLDTQQARRRERQTPESTLTVDDRAVALLTRWIKESRNVNVAALARELGVNRSHLYKCKTFIALWESYQGGKFTQLRGTKDRDTGKVEAWDEDDRDDDE